MLPFITENGSPGDFPSSVCSSYNLKFVVCPFVNEETNGNYPRTKRTSPSVEILVHSL